MADTPTTRSQFWRSDWFVGVPIVLAVFALHGRSDFFRTLARRYHDHASTRTLRESSGRIADIGRWPGRRDAQLIDLLLAVRTRTGLVLDTPGFMFTEQLAGTKVDGRSDFSRRA